MKRMKLANSFTRVPKIKKKHINNFGYLMLGMLMTLLFSNLVVPAAAALVQKTINIFSGVSIYMDDNKFNPKDVNGNPVEVFVYNGTAYLPARAISEALGKPVQWDGTTNSVYIGNHRSTKGTSLFSLATFNGSNSEPVRELSTNVKDNVGNTYAEAFYLHDSMSNEAWATYLLNGQYSSISGDFFLQYEDRAATQDQVLYIYGDDVLLYTATLKAGVQPIHFDVKLTGVIQLKIKSYTAASRNSFADEHYGLANVNLFT